MTAQLTPIDAAVSRPSSAPVPALVVENLSIGFGRGAAPVVRDISFSIGRGDCVALVGESGSGKSVTARAILGLAGRGAVVEADSLRYGETDLLALSEREWRRVRGREVGLVLQDALGSLDPLRRVGREVGEPLLIHGLTSRSGVGEDVRRLLERVGIPGADMRARQFPHELSGGLRQRALIASAIAGVPGILIADEPTTALDVTVQTRILDLLRELREQGTGILLISHDLAVVSHLADEVIVLRNGEIVESGRAEDILTDPKTEYTRALIASVPSVGSRGRSLVDRSPLPPRPPVPEVPVIEAVGLTRSFGTRRAQTVAVADVSFTLHAGEVLGVVGESGSGKSTLGRLILGQLEPDSGTLAVHGRSWRELSAPERRAQRRRVQTVSQDPLGTFDPRATVEDVIAEALSPRLERAARRERIVELLASVGLGETHLRRLPRTLSGGQRQRVAIARALATDPDILVCDEAVSALDVTIQAQVLDLLEHLRATTGVSIVFISHDLGVVHHIADRVLVMKDGRVVEHGPVTDVLGSPQHPYTRELISAIPALPALQT